jgi:hypothetical protein
MLGSRVIERGGEEKKKKETKYGPVAVCVGGSGDEGEGGEKRGGGQTNRCVSCTGYIWGHIWVCTCAQLHILVCIFFYYRLVCAFFFITFWCVLFVCASACIMYTCTHTQFPHPHTHLHAPKHTHTTIPTQTLISQLRKFHYSNTLASENTFVRGGVENTYTHT